MKRIYIFLLFFGITAVTSGQQGLITGKVISVADGDTFTLLLDGNRQQKIRLHGIDCPEKSQDYGQVAKTFVSEKVFGKVVTVKQTDTDRYGRTIALVYLPNSITLNELLLKNGLAWHYTRYDKNPNWTKLEQGARLKKAGLWKQPNPTAPWDFRRFK